MQPARKKQYIFGLTWIQIGTHVKYQRVPPKPNLSKGTAKQIYFLDLFFFGAGSLGTLLGFSFSGSAGVSPGCFRFLGGSALFFFFSKCFFAFLTVELFGNLVEGQYICAIPSCADKKTVEVIFSSRKL